MNVLKLIQNYEFILSGEVLRAVIIIILGVGFTAVARLTDIDAIDMDWWKGVVFSAGLAVVQFLQGRLPAVGGSS